jgi:hypothetical protein
MVFFELANSCSTGHRGVLLHNLNSHGGTRWTNDTSRFLFFQLFDQDSELGDMDSGSCASESKLASGLESPTTRVRFVALTVEYSSLGPSSRLSRFQDFHLGVVLSHWRRTRQLQYPVSVQAMSVEISRQKYCSFPCLRSLEVMFRWHRK